MHQKFKSRSLTRNECETVLVTFHAEWLAWNDLYAMSTGPGWLSTEWRTSVIRFVECGLPLDTLVNAVGIAWRKEDVPGEDKWRYFCGICWRTLKGFK